MSYSSTSLILLTTALAVSISPTPLLAQQASHIMPPAYANAEAPGSTGYGWGQGINQRRVQWVYDSTYFTSYGVDHPILINRLRWRANGASTVATGTFAAATVTLASCPVDCRALSTTFANNLAPDATVVHNGPVTIDAGAGQTPNNWYVDIPLATPFLYDPTLGLDLTTEVIVAPGMLTGSTAIHDAVFQSAATGPVLGGRCQATNATALTGAVSANAAIVIEVGFDYAPGVAYGTKYGAGCYDRAISFYEQFAPTLFDLQNSGVRLTAAGPLYLVGANQGAWVPPVSAPLTGMGDDTISPVQTLPFSWSYPGGTTTGLQICSNGYILPQPTTTTAGQYAPSSYLLVTGSARFAPAWSDWNPAVGGSIHYDVSPSGLSVIVTWLDVPEYQQTTTNSFQVEIDSLGNVEYRYLTPNTIVKNLLVGWSPGANARDMGGTDLSAAMPFVVQADEFSLAVQNIGRPRLGATCMIETSQLPASSLLGATMFGLTAFGAGGIPLDSYGMPGCFQHLTFDSTVLFLLGAGNPTVAFGVPADPLFAGFLVHCQSVVLAPGANALGAQSSNGLSLLFGNL